jgi:uncharacterized protein YggE
VGSVGATPDVVRITLGIRADAEGVAAALGDGATTVRAVSDAARGHGLADRDIASTNASVQPRWDRDGTAVVGYTAYHQLALTVRRITDLDGLVEDVATAAGNRLTVDGIVMDLADRAPLEFDARTVAFRDAEAKARQYAALAHAQLGRVLHVVEGDLGYGAPVPMRDMMMARATGGAAMPLEAGEHTVTASVQVAWALEPVAAPQPTTSVAALPATPGPEPGKKRGRRH